MSYIRSVREVNAEPNTIFIKGEEGADNSWRMIIPEPNDPDGTLQIQRKEPLTETGIDLDEAKIASIEGNPIYTTINQYFASVLTDTRSNMGQPTSLAGDMTGNIVSWDGNAWRFSTDVWWTRQKFASNLNEILAPHNIVGTGDKLVLEFRDLGKEFFDQFQIRFPQDIEIKWDGDRIGSGRVVSVKSQDDFPGVVGGLIQADRFTRYVMDNNVTVINPIEGPSDGAPFEIVSSNFNNNDLRCRIGTQALFQGSNLGGLVLRDIGIEDRDGGVATCFDIEQVDSNDFSKIIIQDVTLIEFASLGNIKGFNSVKWKDNRLALYNEGITFDSCDIMGFEGNLYLGLLEGGAVDVTIQGANGTLSQNAESWSQDDNAIAMDIKSTSTISQGTVTNSTYAVPTGGQFFAPGSKDQTDASYRFEVNGELADSNTVASASFSKNTAVTTIGASGTPVAVNGTTSPGELERFTHDSSGILTYTGTRDITMKIKLIASIDIVGDTPSGRYIETDTIAFCAFIGGSPVPSTRDPRTIASVFQAPTSPQFISEDNIKLSPGDTIQMFVENEDNATDIIVTDLKMLING